MGDVTMMEDRPPLIEFFVDAKEDRNASIQAGHYVGKDITMIKVTPAGGKLEFVNEADEYIRQLRRRGDKYLPLYEEAYKAFQTGQEAPLNGTSIRDWPSLSASQVRLCLSVNVRTIEDLAGLPEEGLQRLGMGSRALQQKAIAWLQAAKSTGRLAEQFAALEARMDAMASELSRKEEENIALKAKLEVKEGPRQSVKASAKNRDVDEAA